MVNGHHPIAAIWISQFSHRTIKVIFYIISPEYDEKHIGPEVEKTVETNRRESLNTSILERARRERFDEGFEHPVELRLVLWEKRSPRRHIRPGYTFVLSNDQKLFPHRTGELTRIAQFVWNFSRRSNYFRPAASLSPMWVPTPVYIPKTREWKF